MVDAIGQFIGDLASAITDAIARFLVDKLHLSPSRAVNLAVRVLVYAVIFIPIAIAVVWVLAYVLLYAGVFLINWLLRGMSS